jgi:hypothetical protein
MDQQTAIFDRRTPITVKISELATVRKKGDGFAFIDHTKSGPNAVLSRISSKVAQESMVKHTKPTIFTSATERILLHGVQAASFQSEGPSASKKAKYDSWQAPNEWSQGRSSSSSWQWKERESQSSEPPSQSSNQWTHEHASSSSWHWKEKDSQTAESHSQWREKK